MLIGHGKQWNFLQRKFESNQLAHAYLFAGAEAIGKKTFAKEFIKFINCLVSSTSSGCSETSSGRRPEPGYHLGPKEGCHKCINCLMLEKESFPDFKLIEKKQGKSEIEISQVRDAQKFLSYKSYYGSLKTLVIDDAERMSQEAQSCFLKTLEEPKGRTIVFLIASKPDILLPTIVSRCQIIKFFRPANLPLDENKLEKEKKILRDLSSVMKLSLSERFKYVKSIDFEQQNPLEILKVFQEYLRYLLFLKTGIGGTKKLENFYGGSALSVDYPVSKIKKTIALADDINNKLLFTNANPKLALEILLMEI